jgi:hypothetical protein
MAEPGSTMLNLCKTPVGMYFKIYWCNNNNNHNLLDCPFKATKMF